MTFTIEEKTKDGYRFAIAINASSILGAKRKATKSGSRSSQLFIYRGLRGESTDPIAVKNPSDGKWVNL